MPAFRNNDFADRRSTAASAKQALLEKFKSRPAEDDPATIKRREERARFIETRAARLAEKDAWQKAEDARRAALREQEEAERLAAEAAIEAERVAVEAALLEEKKAREAAKAAQIERVLADEATRKAARDLRYADRKARVGRC